MSSKPPAGPVRYALEITLEEMRRAGRFEAVDAALIYLTCELASAVDRYPAESRLWGQYRAALRDLLEVGTDDGDTLDDLLDELRAEVGDTSPT